MVELVHRGEGGGMRSPAPGPLPHVRPVSFFVACKPALLGRAPSSPGAYLRLVGVCQQLCRLLRPAAGIQQAQGQARSLTRHCTQEERVGGWVGG